MARRIRNGVVACTAVIIALRSASSKRHRYQEIVGKQGIYQEFGTTKPTKPTNPTNPTKIHLVREMPIRESEPQSAINPQTSRPPPPVPV